MPKAMEQMMKVRVEYIHEPDSDNWCFRVPSLGIIGGADTREQAEDAALEAIRFTLDDNDDTPPADDNEVQFFTMAVTGHP